MRIETGLERIAELARQDHHLAVLVTATESDPQVSVVNAGLVRHPVRDETVVALVARGSTAKLANLRERPRATLVFRAGWEWVAVRGHAELIGPDNPRDGVEVADLLREIFVAAGGHHDDFAVYDRVMARERRTAVLVAPEHIWSNPTGAEHRHP